MAATESYTENDKDLLQNALTGAQIIKVNRVALGGEDRASLYVLICLDSKDTWSNGILENSRYGRVSISNGRIEYFSGGMPCKFRSGKIKDLTHAAKRLNDWIAECNLTLKEKARV